MALPQAANVVFRLSADSLGLANNDPVATWTDSINSVNATATGTERPTFITGLIGGKPAVRFNASTQVMHLGRPTALTTAVDSKTWSVIVVAKVSGSAAYGPTFGAWGSSGFIVQLSGSIAGVYPGGGTIFDAPWTDTTNLASVGFFSDNTNGRYAGFVNGSRIAEDFGTGDTATSNFAVGNIDGTGLPFIGDIYEVIVWDKVLTTLEWLQAQAEINTKYSQTNAWESQSYFTVFDGDSITAGTGAVNPSGSYPYKAAQTLSLPYGSWTNIGIGGQTISQMTSHISEWSGIAAYTGKSTKVAAFEFANNYATTVTTTEADTVTYCSTVRAIANTKLCLGSSTSMAAAYESNGNKALYDAWCDANYSSYSDSYVPFHTLSGSAHIGPVGARDANTSYYYDVLHPNPTGYTELAGVMVTGLNAITFPLENIGIPSFRTRPGKGFGKKRIPFATRRGDTSSASIAITNAIIALLDAADAVAITVANWTTAQISAIDAPDISVIGTSITTGAGIASTDNPDIAAISAANWTTSQLSANDGADVAAFATTVTTGANISATDAPDLVAMIAANWTTSRISGIDGNDLISILTTVTTGAGISATDAADIAAIIANANLGVTSGAISVVDAADIAALTTIVTTSVGISATDTADIIAAAAANWTTAVITLSDASDAVVASTIVTTGAGISASDAADSIVVQASNWAAASIAVADGRDLSIQITLITSGASIVVIDAPDMPAITGAVSLATGASVNVVDGRDTATVSSLVITGVSISALDGQDATAALTNIISTILMLTQLLSAIFINLSRDTQDITVRIEPQDITVRIEPQDITVRIE